MHKLTQIERRSGRASMSTENIDSLELVKIDD